MVTFNMGTPSNSSSDADLGSLHTSFSGSSGGDFSADVAASLGSMLSDTGMAYLQGGDKRIVITSTTPGNVVPTFVPVDGSLLDGSAVGECDASVVLPVPNPGMFVRDNTMC